jgi:hypothetical protein
LRRLASPLQQEFTTGETDLNSHFAQQQSAGANVSSGSKAEVKALIFDVGFTPAVSTGRRNTGPVGDK